MIPFYHGEDLLPALGYPALIDALHTAFSTEMQVPRRHAHALSAEAGASLLLMPVWQTHGQAGVKLVTVVPDNRARALPTVQALFILLDTDTGTPLALMDGETLTLRRTAAASALASRYLSRPDSRHLLLVGTGQLAPDMAVAHATVRELEDITVWGRRRAQAEAMPERLRAAGLPPHIRIRIADDLAAATTAADIICCATTSREPLIFAQQVRPGTHVDLVGGFKPDMREADDALIATAALFVDTRDGALAEAGDLLQPMARGVLTASAVRAELAELVRGQHPGRTSDQEITVFKSVGTAREDLCAATLAWSALNGAG